MAKIVYLAVDNSGYIIVSKDNQDPSKFEGYNTDISDWDDVWIESDYIEQAFGEDDDKIEAWFNGEEPELSLRSNKIKEAVSAAKPDFVFEAEGSLKLETFTDWLAQS
jgi:hypothetical protein